VLAFGAEQKIYNVEELNLKDRTACPTAIGIADGSTGFYQ
jgi:hypothetical protein